MMSAPIRKPQLSEAKVSYHDDLHGWSKQQAAFLQEGRLAEIDLINLADEIEDVGNEQYDKLESALRVLLQHLLKWDHQPAQRSRSWVLTIREQRRRIERVLRKNPSLKAALEEAVAEAYDDGRDLAAGETGYALSAFPVVCPYSFLQIISREIVTDDL